MQLSEGRGRIISLSFRGDTTPEGSSVMKQHLINRELGNQSNLRQSQEQTKKDRKEESGETCFLPASTRSPTLNHLMCDECFHLLSISDGDVVTEDLGDLCSCFCQNVIGFNHNPVWKKDYFSFISLSYYFDLFPTH